MSAHQAIYLVCLLFCTATAGWVHAEEDEVEFKGYTRHAELAVRKLLKTVSQLKTYSDDATFQVKMSMGFSRGDMPASFSYEKPRRFRLRTEAHDVCSNGKELTVYQKRARRYIAKPLEKDIDKQIRPYSAGSRIEFSIGRFLLAVSHEKYFAEQFTDLDRNGEETIEGERCIVLTGSIANAQRFDGSSGEADATLWLRKSDSMVRRLEIDLSPVEDEEDEDEEEQSPLRMFMRGVKVIYDVRDLKVNEPIDKSEFVFEPPTGVKKVDRFYTGWTHTGDTAMQFELSGKPAPKFELETTEGDWISLSSLEGNVVVLDFLFAGFGFMRPQGLEELDAIRRDYADRKVSVLCIYPRDSADRVLNTMDKKDLEFAVLLDPGSDVTSKYFEERFAQGIVLVDKKGIVQGRYPGSVTTESVESLRKDIDKLLEGKTLPGGQPLSEEQLEEVREQRSASYTTDAADPLNEDDLKEAWAVRAVNNRGFAFRFGSGGTPSRGLWIRDKDVVRKVDARGEVIAEIPIPDPSHDQFSQDQFVVGRFGGRLAIAYMTTIPGDEQRGFGWRRPKGATITVGDATGRELWDIELEAKGGQVPQHLAAGNLDGRTGDELLFCHQGNLWIVDGRGRVVVRKPVSGSPQWMQVEDLDGDKRAEIYLRTQDKLYRYDYQP